MSFLRRIGEAIGRKAAEDYVASEDFRRKLDAAITTTVREVLAEPRFAWFRFVKLIQAELLRVDPTMNPRRAFYAARDAYFEMLKDNKVEFGDPDFDWSADGAREIAHAYEIDHWEVAE